MDSVLAQDESHAKEFLKMFVKCLDSMINEATVSAVIGGGLGAFAQAMAGYIGLELIAGETALGLLAAGGIIVESAAAAQLIVLSGGLAVVGFALGGIWYWYKQKAKTVKVPSTQEDMEVMVQDLSPEAVDYGICFSEKMLECLKKRQT